MNFSIKKTEAKLSNVYLYKNHQMHLINHLENVYIQQINISHSCINIILNNDPSKTCTLIHLNEIYNNKKENKKEKTKEKSVLSICCDDTWEHHFLTPNLDLYLFRKENVKSEENKKEEPVPKKRILKEREVVEIKNISHILEKTKRSYNDDDNNNSDDSFILNYLLEKGTLKKKKILYIPLEQIFFCNYEFFGINKYGEVYKWIKEINFAVNEPNKQVLQECRQLVRYQSNFINYVRIQEKEQIKQISCGANHTLFLSSKGNCYVSGSNDSYQIGIEGSFFSNLHLVSLKTEESISIKKKVVVMISAGYAHNLIVTNDNEIYGWGNNIYGQLISPKEPFVKKPKLILNYSIWKDILKKKTILKKMKKKKKGNHPDIEESDENNIDKEKKEAYQNNMHPIQKLDRKFYKIIQVKKKNKLEIKKICCGFSFSCFLLKNRNCFMLGKSKDISTKNCFDIPVKMNHRKREIDDIYCNFFDILLIMHLRIVKVEPSLIKPNSSNSICIFLNFPLKTYKHIDVELFEWNIANKKNQEKEEKEEITTTSVHIKLSCIKDQKKYMFNVKEIPNNDREFYDKTLWEVSSVHSFYRKINSDLMNKKIGICLRNTYCSVKSKNPILISNYEGKIKRVIPDNIALLQNVKLKIQIEKSPIYVEKGHIYILLLFLRNSESSSINQKETCRIVKGRMNKKRNYLYTNLSFINKKDPLYLKEEPTFHLCKIYFSFSNHFYPYSYQLPIVTPHICYLSPNIIYVNEQEKVVFQMENSNSHFEYVHLILYHPKLKIIHKKASYDYEQKNYFFFMTLFPKYIFNKINSESIEFKVLSSFNKIEYCPSEFSLTIYKER